MDLKKDTYKKYKTQLDAIKLYINNDYIYNIFFNYGFTVDETFINLDSNINVYEACFIAQLVSIYIKTFKRNDELSVIEIGLAYGTSSLIIANEMIKYRFKKKYVIIDPNQTKQWKNVGIKNLNNFLKHLNKKLPYELIEESSDVAMTRLENKFDISFIDGSHEESIVIQDIKNSDRLLKENGLMILDDVLHTGVKDAIIDFFKDNKNYFRICIDKGKFKNENFLYDVKLEKKSFNNPKTMYCFQKRIK